MFMRKTLVTEISSLLILLFIYTALSKLSGYPHFKSVLTQSPLIAGNASVVALALPITGIMVSLLFICAAIRAMGILWRADDGLYSIAGLDDPVYFKTSMFLWWRAKANDIKTVKR